MSVCLPACLPIHVRTCCLHTGPVSKRERWREAFPQGSKSSHATLHHAADRSTDRATEDNDAAANILQHLATVLSEERDKKLPAETRLLRMLLRTEKAEERVAMLLEKLLLRNPPPRPKVRNEETGEEEDYEPFWGQPEVEAEALTAAIGSFLEEVQSFAHELDTDVLDRAKAVQGEIEAIVKTCN